MFCELLGCAGRNDLPATAAPFGAKIDDPIGGFYDVEIVFDDDDRVTVVAQSVQHFEQLLDVVKVQPGGWLVEDVERLSGVSLRQLPR